MNESTQTGSGGVRRGVGLGFLMNLIYVVVWIGVLAFGGSQREPLRPVFQEAFFWSPFFIGATQALYIGPAVLYYRWHDRPGVVKGLIIAAALTVLLNGMCWAVVTRI